MKKILISALAFLFADLAFGQVAINTDGSPVTDPVAMFEIKKNQRSKARIRSTAFTDTAQLELSNRNGSNKGTDIIFSANGEEGLLISSSSDVPYRRQDSIFSIKIQTGTKSFFGMNVKDPSALLHIHDPNSSIAMLKITNSSTGVVGNSGVVLSMVGNSTSLINTENGSLNLGTNNSVYGNFTSAGNFGLGTFSPSEKLGVSGNVILSSSNKGILMDSQDRPLVTRGWDAFTSGIYNGVGRWGVFMEPSRITVGFPNFNGGGFKLAAYNANSTIGKNVMQVSLDGGLNATMNIDAKVTSPTTNLAHLLPIAYGTVDGNNGNILNGTGNFSFTKFGTGSYGIILTGETYSTSVHTVQATVCSDGQPAIIKTLPSAGNMVVSIISYNGTTALDRVFSFMVYKPTNF